MIYAAACREIHGTAASNHNYRPAGALNYEEARPWEHLRTNRAQPQIF